MIRIETNIYLIKNLGDLNCKYRVYGIRGIPDIEDYYKNTQLLVDILSRKTKSPCILCGEDQELLIAQPEGYPELPNTIELVRTTARIEKHPELYDLNFDSLTPETAKLATRFLQFSLQDPLYHNPSLWQPQAGYPFYSKNPDLEFRKHSKTVDLYNGFTYRVVTFSDGRIGICVDTRSKYVARNPLSTNITLKEYREEYKGQHCVYDYGNTRYEIKLAALNDLNVSEVILPEGVSLFEDVHNKAGSRKSQNLLALPDDCSVLVYYSSLGAQRNVPSGLCRLTCSTDHPDVKPFHAMTIKLPHKRREEIEYVVNTYLKGLSFGSAEIILAETPLVVDDVRCLIPDLKFGNNKILSLQGRADSITTSLKDFPRKKKELLYSSDGGLFKRKKFDRQYFIMPQSIYESFSEQFLAAIKENIQRLCPKEEGMVYSPIIIPYNDSVQKSVYNLAKAINMALDDNEVSWGYGIVMIPRLASKTQRKEEDLTNFLMSDLRQRELYVSIIHTEIPTESFVRDNDNSWALVSDQKQRSKFKGYVGNVVLNKILITNNIWPFVLGTPLHADLTIGIDVKNNTAGFALIYKSGAEIRFFSSESDQKEQLSKTHTSAKVYEILKDEQELLSKKIKKIIVHRQGILFPSEKKGITRALDRLAKENIIGKDYQCTFVEIRTTSRIPLRLFRVTTPVGKQMERTNNPTTGQYTPITENDAFVCTTGYPYGHKGTTRPLHVVKIGGEMSLEHILADVFALANLTWTKIDDCSRLPLSIKMNDIRLREIAGEYDRDLLRFGEEED